MNTKTGVLTATLASAVVLIAAQAYANTVALFTRTIAFTFSTPTRVPLNNAGAGQVTYSGSGRRTITYIAECSKDGVAGWVSIAIVVDGVQLAPTGNSTDDAFCSSNGTAAFDGWVMAAAQGRTANLPSGPHIVQIVASTVGGGTGRLDDSALKIER